MHMHRINMTAIIASITASTCFAQTSAFRSTHIGVDTATGTAGDQLLLRTGYGTSGAPESEAWSYRFELGSSGGELQTRTQRYADNPAASFDQVIYNLQFAAPATIRAAEGGGTSPVAGWRSFTSLAGQPSSLRSSFNPTGGDAFAAAGRLVGGSFAYEILSVTPLLNSPSASFAIGMMETSGITDDSQRRLQRTNAGFDVFGVYDPALSAGGALADRSIHLGYANHFHGWGFFISDYGRYEISMRVYDVNNVYTPSEAFTFQINSVPAPAASLLLALAPLAASRRRRA